MNVEAATCAATEVIMRRRRFLGGISAAIAAGGAAPILGTSPAGADLPIIRPGGPRGPSYRFLTNDPAYVDARPCYSPDGRHILFMRSHADDQNESDFWIVPVDGGDAQVFYADERLQATRPDWSWSRRSYEIAFAGIEDMRLGIWLLDVRTREVAEIPFGDPASVKPSYPSWYPDGRSLIATNYETNVQQILRSNLVNPPVPLTDPALVWAGMASVSRSIAAGNPIAFAGQVPNAQGYDQDENQIWIQETGKAPYQLDPAQARSPWWSPDGQAVAFESNRNDDGTQVYQIFTGSADGLDATAITPHALATQHAKWSPVRPQLTFAVAFPAGGAGVAVVDLGQA